MNGETRVRELSPRSLVGVFDAAFELSASNPGIVFLSVLGMAPVAFGSLVLWYGSVEAPWDETTQAFIALGCALLTLWRHIPGGAVAHLGLSHLHGEPVPTPLEALGVALRRGPSLIVAGTLVMWVCLLSIPLVGLPLLGWSGTFLALPLVLRRECPPWGAARAGRRLLRSRHLEASVVTALWLFGVCVVAGNLWMLTYYGLELSRALLDVDVGLLSGLLSPKNPLFLPTLGAIALVLLEPVRQTSLAVLYVDAHVRRDGLDLQVAVDELESTSRKRGSRRLVAGLVLALGLGALAPFAAHADGRDDLHRAAVVLMSVGEDVDTDRVATLAASLPESAVPALGPLADRIEADVDAGAVGAARARLERALEEMSLVVDRADNATARSPQDLAREILARPEFQRFERTRYSLPEDEPEEPSEFQMGAWERLMRWLGDWLEELFRDADGPDTSFEAPTGGLDLQWVLWSLALAALVALVILGVKRALDRGEVEVSDEGAVGADAAVVRKVRGALADALARAPDAWLAEADRLASEGRFREALRAAYLALLSSLHRADAIDYRRTRTNTDLLRTFRGTPPARATFAEVTGLFELVWYGGREADRGRFQRVRTGALSVAESLGGDRA